MTRLGKTWILMCVGLVAAAGCTVAWFLTRESCSDYRYINKHIACAGTQSVDKTNYLALQNTVASYIEQKEDAAKVGEIAVYFRDLDDGPVFAVNSSYAFAPASLLKLPMMFALFTLNEQVPGLLDTKLLYSRAELSKKYTMPVQINFDRVGEDLIEGGTYTMRDLMRASIVYSDNTAYMALVDYINTQYPGGTDFVLKTFQELGVIDPRTPEEETISVRDYSSLFRLLYNASFLSVEDSEEVLSWLVESNFDSGLQAGVPADIVVANKFGERQEGSDRRLHDCGIIYYPGNPYTLCIMTSGTDWSELKTVIGDISAMVYKEVDSRAK